MKVEKLGKNGEKGQNYHPPSPRRVYSRVAVPLFTPDVPAAPNTESDEGAAVTDIQFENEWGGGG